MTIPLKKISPEKSCAIFNFRDNITINSTDGNVIKMTPYHIYNFYTGLLTKDMKEGNGSGFGPRICFVQNGQNSFTLNIENSSDQIKVSDDFCPTEGNMY